MRQGKKQESKNGKLESELEEFSYLLDKEKFPEAKKLASRILKTDDSNRAMLNYTGYEVINKYIYSNKSKAGRIANAFKEYLWHLWLK